MLAAGTDGTIRIDSQIIVIDLNINILLDIRHDIAGYKGCLPLTRRIER